MSETLHNYCVFSFTNNSVIFLENVTIPVQFFRICYCKIIQDLFTIPLQEFSSIASSVAKA